VAHLTTFAADVGTVYFTTLDNKVRKVRLGSETQTLNAKP
jgi:outer membrane murein-binding lipoprotein Lpp